MKYTIKSTSDLFKLDFKIKVKHTFNPFEEDTLNFIDDFSKLLLKDKALRIYPEIVALGFWLRKSNIKKIQSDFLTNVNSPKLFVLPRGLVFHVSPANVDTMFVYSWILSLLIGNSNIVRIPSSNSEQIRLLINCLNTIISKKEYELIKNSNYFIEYGHDDEINKYLSGLCDVRVIWGGENTINGFRKYPIKDTAKEVSFTNKFSLSFINPIYYLEYKDKHQIADLFFNDAYFMEQRACSAPKLIVWLGDKKHSEEAQEKFWKTFETRVNSKKPMIDMSMILNKFTDLTVHSMLKKVKKRKGVNNLLDVIRIDSIEDIDIAMNPGGGLFYEIIIDKIEQLSPILNRSYQTATVLGVSSQTIIKVINQENLGGIDRFVNIGEAPSFNYIWDGFNLLYEFSRLVTIDID